MKTSKAIILMMMALTMCVTPALAQRNGGGSGSRGGGSHSSSVSSSRSSSISSSSSSSPSRSSSSSSSVTRSSYSSPSRSSASNSATRSSYSSPSRSSSSNSATRSSYSSPSRNSASNSATRSSYSSPSRSSSSSSAVRAEGSRDRSRGFSRTTGDARQAGTTSRGTRITPANDRGRTAGSSTGDTRVRTSNYARAGYPGGYIPPADRPIHPAPYFHHPWHHHMVHCHPIFWDPIPARPWYWPGFWVYCNSYWYDYHVTDVVVVHDYVKKTYNVDMVTYGISGDIMYAIVRDGGDTYLQVYDKDDHLLAEQKINRKYCNMVIDAENGGCWISKKHEKDPLLFIWADGQLLIYEED